MCRLDESSLSDESKRLQLYVYIFLPDAEPREDAVTRVSILRLTLSLSFFFFFLSDFSPPPAHLISFSPPLRFLLPQPAAPSVPHCRCPSLAPNQRRGATPPPPRQRYRFPNPSASSPSLSAAATPSPPTGGAASPPPPPTGDAASLGSRHLSCGALTPPPLPACGVLSPADGVFSSAGDSTLLAVHGGAAAKLPRPQGSGVLGSHDQWRR